MNPSSDGTGCRTSASLLLRVRNTQDGTAWREFNDLYRELLTSFCRRKGLQHSDSEDVVQRVMANLIKTLPQFVYDSNRGRFRDYLYRCIRSAISEWSKRRSNHHAQLDTPVAMFIAADAESDGDGADVSLWEQEWVAHHYRLARATVQTTVEARSLEIFDRSIAGESVQQLAAAFEMNQEAVRKVRQRIRARMEELIAAQIRAEDSIYG